MKPLQHAQISAHRYGGEWADWLPFHNWVDQSKALFASLQHRMLLHSDFGAWLAPLVLGETITARDGQSAATCVLFTDHLVEDLGRIVPLSEWLSETRMHAHPDRHKPPRALGRVREAPAEGLAARWGGTAKDYHALIAFFDKPRALAPDRGETAEMITHSSFGIYLAEQLLGVTITLSTNDGRGRIISTRSAAEDLVHARLGRIPPASLLLARTRLRLWMCGTGVRPALRERLQRERYQYATEELPNSCSTNQAETLHE